MRTIKSGLNSANSRFISAPSLIVPLICLRLFGSRRLLRRPVAKLSIDMTVSPRARKTYIRDRRTDLARAAGNKDFHRYDPCTDGPGVGLLRRDVGGLGVIEHKPIIGRAIVERLVP